MPPSTEGFMTVEDDGAIVMSDALHADDSVVLGLYQPLRVRGTTDGHRGCLPWHRARVFRDRRAEGGAS